MLPQAGVGGCTPNPRNEMAASATMNCENCKLATMMMDGATLGRMWRNRMRARLVPGAGAAWANSRCFTDRTSPRATRAYTTQPAADKLIEVLPRTEPNK